MWLREILEAIAEHPFAAFFLAVTLCYIAENLRPIININRRDK